MSETLLTEILKELQAQNRNARLWDAHDVGAYFNVSAQSARNRLLCRPDFPRPISVPGIGRRWKPAEVKAYADRAR
jgi:hypothetical protein